MHNMNTWDRDLTGPNNTAIKAYIVNNVINMEMHPEGEMNFQKCVNWVH